VTSVTVTFVDIASYPLGGDAPKPSEAELARARQYRTEADRHRYLVTHSALRQVLARELRTPASSLKFDEDELGRPFIREAALDFNLSHSGTLAAIGVATGRRIGVDVQLVDPAYAGASLAEIVCTPSELAHLSQYDDDLRRAERFVRMWTAKEAIGKAFGVGLCMRLKDLQAPDLDEVDRPLEFDYDGQGWTLIRTLPRNGYVAAVAVQGSGAVFRCDWL
jgi:4'-phosphopantetheinyl transferase